MRRGAALIALGCLAAAVAIAVGLAIVEFPLGLLVVALLAAALAGAGTGLLHRGRWRAVGFLIALAALISLAALILVEGRLLENVVMIALAAIAVAAARRVFLTRVVLAAAPAPTRPVLIYNPLSGDGTAERVALAEQARARGFAVVELRRGDDLRALVRTAVADGADALAMAGGDGSQAIVAAIAAELGLPYACIPAGTRNHFALDLGVDRDDVIGALEAFVDGGERVVDLAEVNGQVFVNNVSLGLYAEAVQRSGYREAKIRTLLDVLPDAIESGGQPQMRWIGPDGDERRAAAAVLVSNNVYRLGGLIGSGTRPRIDGGVLGLVAVGPVMGEAGAARAQPRWEEWSAPSLRIDADEPVFAGIDGEAATLVPPLEFRIRPRALRVRIARDHPGASPSAIAPDGFTDGLRRLARIAAGRDDRTTTERTNHGHSRS